MNDRGQAVGISGACSIAVGGLSARAMVLWENGQPTEIPNFGGIAWNTPMAINRWGDVVGFANASAADGADPNFRAFLWTRRGGLRQLLLPGDTSSQALGINDWGQVVGQSCGPGGCRGFLYQHGRLSDVNDMLVPGYPVTSSLPGTSTTTDASPARRRILPVGKSSSPSWPARPSTRATEGGHAGGGAPPVARQSTERRFAAEPASSCWSVPDGSARSPGRDMDPANAPLTELLHSASRGTRSAGSGVRRPVPELRKIAHARLRTDGGLESPDHRPGCTRASCAW